MDYKYIEQLLQRYWDCETTSQEETILHKFFAQDDVPAHLLPYKQLFEAMEPSNEQLSSQFDERILALIDEEEEAPRKTARTVKARRLTLSYSLRPLFKAAAMVAMVLTISLAVQQAMEQDQTDNVVNLPPAVVPGAPETAYDQAGNPILPDTLENAVEPKPVSN